jgi:hypothetical protein
MERILNAKVVSHVHTNPDGTTVVIQSIVQNKENPYTYFDPSVWSVEDQGFPPIDYKPD